MTPYKSLQKVRISPWVLLPMRLFLGITFFYAGVQKLADPQFFRPGTPGYIGHQLIAFANGSPIRFLLIQVAVPHATFFGLLIAYGEIAIGLGTLVGLLLRPAALAGMLLSILFFLSASWHIYPYFYGSDIVFTFCWLTMLINGPLNTGLPSLDELLTLKILEHTSPQLQARIAFLLRILLGTATGASEENTAAAASQLPPARVSGQQRVAQQRRQAVIQQQQHARRNFIWGLVSGGAGMLGIVGIIYAFRVLRQDDTAPVGTTPSTPSATATADTGGAAGPTSVVTTGGTTNAIAQVSAVQTNSSLSFTIPSSGDPGILVHLSNDQFVAFDATCTHAGCPVDYDPGSHLLACPCHGAQFDPAQNANVVQGPANTPLTPVAIHVDSATGAITLA